MIIFKFNDDKKFKRALEVLNWEIDNTGSDKFDHNFQKKDRTIQVTEKNAPVLEGLFKDRGVKDFKIDRGYGKLSSDVRALAFILAGRYIFKDDKVEKNITKIDALNFVKKLYPGIEVKTEPMANGIAYYAINNGVRHLVANYSPEKKELWYRELREYRV